MAAMDMDLFFVTGLVLLVLAFPAVVGAVADGRAPRAAAILVMVGGGLVALAVWQRPGAYGWDGIPDAFVRVAARFF